MNKSVYDGIRILDFTIHVQGPVCTQFLGDFGAEIIKIERPGSGDFMRGREAQHGINGTAGYGTGFVACNRNKQSVAINLKAPEGKMLILELVKKSDVVVSNAHPGTMERMGLGYDELRSINPRIICAYGSGYGQTGPSRKTYGQDTAAAARAGSTALGFKDGKPPVTAGANNLEFYSGIFLAVGIMLALAAREKTGHGQRVDANFINTAVAANGFGLTDYLNRRDAVSKPPPAPGNPAYRLYEAADGKWFHVSDTFTDRPLERMGRALGLADAITNEPRFLTVQGLTPEAYREITDLLSDAIGKLSRAEAMARLEKEGLFTAPVNEWPEVVADPQVQHNGMILEMEHPQAGPMKTAGFPIRLSETPAVLRLAPPLLGEHNEAVFGGILEMSADQIKALYEKQIISKG